MTPARVLVTLCFAVGSLPAAELHVGVRAVQPWADDIRQLYGLVPQVEVGVRLGPPGEVTPRLKLALALANGRPNASAFRLRALEFGFGLDWRPVRELDAWLSPRCMVMLAWERFPVYELGNVRVQWTNGAAIGAGFDAGVRLFGAGAVQLDVEAGVTMCAVANTVQRLHYPYYEDYWIQLSGASLGLVVRMGRR